MKLNAYCIYDEKACAYNNPFFFGHDGQATRAFEDEANSAQSAIAAHAGDYKLYRVGDFDTESGKINPLPEPVFLVSGDQVKAITEAN